MLDWKIDTFKEESILLLLNGLLNGLDLLGNNGKYFKFDSVEFIETDPAST
jgi:hypothetical protein